MRKIYKDTKERFKVYAEKHKERLAERTSKWNEVNREKRNAVSKAWRERNKEQMAEIKRLCRINHSDTDKAYYNKNKVSINERTKKWANDNPSKRSETYKKYRNSHPEKSSRDGAVRRLRIESGKIKKFTAKQLNDRLSVFGGKCWMCGGIANQIDHVIPLAKGGLHILSNLRPACGKCNRMKGVKKISINAFGVTTLSGATTD